MDALLAVGMVLSLVDKFTGPMGKAEDVLERMDKKAKGLGRVKILPDIDAVSRSWRAPSTSAWTAVGAGAPVARASVSALLEDRLGTLWIGTTAGLFRSGADGASPFTRVGGLSNDTITAVLEDHEGTLWVGTSGGGLNRLRTGAFAPFDRRQSLTDDVAYAVTGARDGGLWIGTGNGHVNRLQRGLSKAVTI